MADSHRPVALLAAGALVGLAMAALGLLSASPSPLDALPREAAALVDGVEIRRGKLERLVAGLESNIGREATAEERRHVLDRLIEEELLVERGLDLGLARHDQGVRAKLVSAMLEEITSNSLEREPTPEELRSFYAGERGFFTSPERLRVARVVFRERESEGGPGTPAATVAVMQRAREAREKLAEGMPLATVREALGDEAVLRVPNALLPPAKLREYLGPAALRKVAALAVGGITAPLPLGRGVELIQLIERAPARTPPFEALEPRVRAEWIRRAGDRALRRELDALRGDAKVIVAPDLR